MTNFATKQSKLISFLNQKFSNTLKNIDVKIKIRKIKDIILVNDIKIYRDKGVWWVGEDYFYYKKSAVGYAICMENGHTTRAKSIYKHDSYVYKYTNDLIFYKHNVRNSKSKSRKLSLGHRIIEDTYRLRAAKTNLDTDLKTVKIT